MPFLYSILAVIASFIFLVIVFVPLEKAFPAKSGQRFFRPDWFTDLCFFLGQYLIFNAAVFFVLFQLSQYLDPVVPGSFRAAVAGQPWWLQVIEVIFLSDLFIYWGHRLQHANSFLWRFHSIHHTSEHLDWLAAHREHPIDSVYSIGLINLPAFLFGFSLDAIAGFIAFRGVWAIYIHSNVRLPLGPLRMLVGAPELHHWHHHLARDAGNYANLSPLMDLMFGTYRCPDHEPEALGVTDSPKPPKSYLALMLHPFRLPAPKQAETQTPPLPQPKGS
jgi:sterol desaturase/sphingolipid hydroxylase (fatty acid hydroxylase superfamily)